MSNRAVPLASSAAICSARVFDRSSWLAQLCAAFLLLSAATASATPAGSERETARTLMEEGDRLSAQDDPRAALIKYQAAHAIMHVPTTGLDVARTHAKLGQLVEARGIAIEVMNMPPAPNEPRVFTEAREAASELAEKLKTRVPTISVKVTPADGPHTVAIDGTRLPIEARDIAFRVNPGTHTVQVELPGSFAEQKSVTLAEGQASVVHFELTPSPVARPQPLPQPLVEQRARPRPEVLQPAAAAVQRADEDPAKGGRIRSLVGFSLGGAALVIGAVAGVVSLARVDELKERCPDKRCSPADRDDLQTAILLGNVSNVTLPIGVLGLAWGLYEMLTLPSSPAARPQAAASLRFELTATGATLHGTL
jgi:hypothetical protein